MKISYVLFDNGGDLLKLGELVPIVVLEHAFGANKLMTNSAEVLDLLILVLEAENTTHVRHL